MRLDSTRTVTLKSLTVLTNRREPYEYKTIYFICVFDNLHDQT